MYSSSILNDYDYNDEGHISKTNTSSVHYNHHDNDKQQHQYQHQYERREREGNYIRNSGSILVKLRILLDAYDQLVTIYIKNKEIAYEEIHYSVITSFNRNKHRATSDASVYMSLIVESVLTPKISDDGNLTLQIKAGHLHDIHDKILRKKAFVKEVITLVQLRKKTQSSANLLLNDDLLQECYSHLASTCQQQTSEFYSDLNSTKNYDNTIIGMPSYREKKLLSNRHPLTSLLAIIRKQGMDLLLPSSVQDKILVTIFVAIQAEVGPAHKELIDMVIAVKETKWQVELEQISKTKIRGVLTLLKHAESLSLQAAKDDTPVALGIAKDISCFEDLRVKHDKFLQSTASKENVKLLISDWKDLIWPDSLEERAKRVALCKKYEKELVIYFEERKVLAILAEEKLQKEKAKAAVVAAATAVVAAAAALAEEEKLKEAELKMMMMMTNEVMGGNTTISKDDWTLRDDWTSKDEWTSSKDTHDDWGMESKDNSRDDWCGGSNWSSQENTPDNKKNSEPLHHVLPQQIYVSAVPVHFPPNYTYSTTGPISSLKVLPLPNTPLPPISPLVAQTHHHHQTRCNFRHEQRAESASALSYHTISPRYNLWEPSSFVSPNTILHSGLRNNVDIIDLTLSMIIMSDDDCAMKIAADSLSPLQLVREGGRFSPSSNGIYSDSYDQSSPFDLLQSFSL